LHCIIYAYPLYSDQIGIGKFVFEEEEEIDLSNLRISKAFEVVGMEQIGNQLEAIFCKYLTDNHDKKNATF